MSHNGIFVSELSTSKHVFANYHFCRGNSNRRKTRLGLVTKGQGTYIYLNQRLAVNCGDVVFIPENIYCYSEWHGTPEIEVVYVSCFMHYESYRYLPQRIPCDAAVRERILQIATLLSGEDAMDTLEAYAQFYRLLQTVLPQMEVSEIAFDKTLQTAVEYVTEHWQESFSIADLAKKCCVSESTVYHLFQRSLGQTPIRFLHSIRINVAIEYLENSDYSISTISRLTGFRSENHFRRIFSDLTGRTPSRYRRDR